MPRPLVIAMLFLAAAGGCAAVRDVVAEPELHNPFPQLRAVAVLPFANQSDTDPTVHGEVVANLYATQLQEIPGFEVVPIGVTRQAIVQHKIVLEGPAEVFRSELRRLGRLLKVDAVVVGSVTDFTPYYPPRMGLAVDWYAVNPCFHPIPPGYGLPWGLPEEEFIPSSLVREAEFALAREQLKTQTPANPEEQVPAALVEVSPAAHQAPDEKAKPNEIATIEPSDLLEPSESSAGAGEIAWELPANWPDPAGFVPSPPSPFPPPCRPQTEPILSHVRQFNGSNAEFTQALARHFYLKDDARFGGWQAYLQRSDDFISFCCYLHIAEMLAARGGAGESGVVWRWPIGRYER
jgi:hypothetical protein